MFGDIWKRLLFISPFISVLIWQIAIRSEFSRRVTVIGVLGLNLTLIILEKCCSHKHVTPKRETIFRGVWMNCWRTVRVSTFRMRLKRPNAILGQCCIANQLLPLHIARNFVERYAAMGRKHINRFFI
jgi:hypothetical protein